MMRSSCLGNGSRHDSASTRIFHDERAPGFEMSKPKKGCIGMDMLLKMDTLHFTVPSIHDHMKHPG